MKDKKKTLVEEGGGGGRGGKQEFGQEDLRLTGHL